MKEMILTITFKSDPSYLPIIRSVIRGISSHKTSDPVLIGDIELSIHEALANVIGYAYRNEPNHRVNLSVSWSNEDIFFEIRDTGQASLIPFAPPLPELGEIEIEDLMECGRGLFFIYRLMDEISYINEKGGNTLLLRKHFAY